MASTIIHMAVGQKIGNKINRKSSQFMIGTIAPDLAKIIGESKTISHFIDGLDNDIPNIDRFLQKYISFLDDDFVLGYFIHLYTDYLWFKYFLPEIFDKEQCLITNLNNEEIHLDEDTFINYVYNDYTNLNDQLIKKYQINVQLFYEPLGYIKPIIDEIKINELDKLQKKSIQIINSSAEEKEYLFNIKNVDQFIEMCDDLIMAKLREVYL